MTIVTDIFNDLRFIIPFRSKIMKQQLALNRKAPKAGDLAPDFTLQDVNGSETVTLSSFRSEKPVALIFGSFT